MKVPDILLDDVPLKVVDKQKDLGVVFDSKLSMDRPGYLHLQKRAYYLHQCSQKVYEY